MKKNLLTLFLMLCSLSWLSAQVSAYTLTSSAGTYTPLDTLTATAADAVEVDYGVSSIIPIGFNFDFEGVTYTDVKAASDGFLSFNTASTSQTANNLDFVTATSRPLVAPLWDDHAGGATTATSAASYITEGTAPNRVFTFEWLNWEWRYNSSDPVISFQAKLYETTNVVEFVYQQEFGTVSTGSASIGITGLGLGSGTFLSLDGSGATPSASSTVETTNINTKPATGQMYTFAPPTCPQPTSLNVTNVTTTSADLNWTSGGGSHWQIEYGAPGFTLGTGTLVSGAAPATFNLSGLTAQTSYDWYVRDSCGVSDLSNWSAVSTVLTLCTSQMSGVYSIGPLVTDDYADFTSVAAELNDCGINGPVVINVAAGTYAENMELNDVVGTSLVNTITFNGADAATTILSTDGVSTSFAGISLNGTKYVIIKNLTVENTKTGGDAWGIHLTNGTNGVVIDSCIVQVAVSTTFDRGCIISSGSFTSASTDGNNADNLIISNNTINNGYYGIYLNGAASPASAFDNGIVIENNTIDAYYYGIYLDNIDSISIMKNTILNSAAYSQADGIYAFDLMNFQIVENTINVPDYGLYISDGNFDDVANGRSLIANNMIQSDFDYGIYTSDVSETDFFFNSVIADRPFYRTGTSTGLDVRNNIFVSNNNDYAFQDLNTTPSTIYTALDYNIYNTSGTNMFDFGPLYVDLAAFQADAANAGFNTNAIVGDPVFLSTTDLHVGGTLADNIGTPIATILNDIDGDMRSATTPDIGADEYAAPSCAQPSSIVANAIGSDSVSVSWTLGASETAWDIEYGLTSFVQGAGTMMTAVTTNPSSIIGLMANTTYDVYVRANCGVATSTWAGPFTFATNCVPFTAPYSQNFDGTADPIIDACWSTFIDAGGSTSATITTDQNGIAAHSGPNKIEMYNQANTLPDDTMLLISPQFSDFANDKRIKFWASDDGFATNDLIIGTMSDPTDASTFTAFETIPEASLTATPQEFTVLFTSYVGTDQYVAFMHGATDTYDDLYIDDFSYSLIPTCIEVSGLAVTNVTDLSVDLGWTSTAPEFVVEYGPAGFVAGTGTTVISTTNTVSLSSLMSNTAYDWCVRAVCLPGDSSTWECGSFNTNPGAPVGVTCAAGLATVIFTEDFENNNAGWTGSIGTSNGNWEIPDGATSGSTGADDGYLGGNFMNYEASSTTANQGSIVSPAIDLSVGSGEAELSFWMHAYGASMGTLSIGVGTSPTGPFTNEFTWTGQLQTSGADAWVNIGVDLTAYLGSTIYLEFNQVDAIGVGSGYDGDMSIDFVEVSTCQTCFPTSNETTSNLTFASADLSWTTGGSTDWIVEWGLAGFSQGTGTVINSTTDSFTLSGLMANTDYEWYVRDSCGPTDLGAWSGVNTFYTGYCIPAPASTDANGIVNVTMGSINNTSAALGNDYANYTTMITDAGQGVSFDISVTVQHGYGIWAWIDWNNDLDFDDAGEYVFLGETTNGVALNSSIMIPATATLGNHVIRIGGSDFNHGSTSTPDPCYTGSWGSFEDYTLNVITCNIPVMNIPTTFCDGDSIVLSTGVSVLTAGMYNDTLFALSGCDSVLTYDVTVLMPSVSVQDMTICQGETVALSGGTMVSSAGVYVEVLMNAVGCDSTVTTTVVVNVATASSEDVHLCDGATFTLPLSGLVVSAANAYVETTMNSVGCDSVITYNVTTGMSSTSAVAMSFCTGGDVTLADGTVVTMAGTYTATETNASGCDEVITYTVTENMPSMSTMTETICDNGSFMFDGQTLTMAGVYTMMETAANGCDSTVELTLTVNATSSSMMTESICEGESFMFDGTALTMSGTYTQTAMNASGCDSVVTLMLTVNATSSSMMNETICEGASFMFDGTALTTAGTYTQTMMNAAGCDSVITLTLTVNDPADETMTTEICKGSEYAFGTQTLTEAGVYTETFTNVSGCEYDMTLTLVVNNNLSTSEDVLLCGDQLSYTLANGTVVTEAGIYTALVPADNGCDNIITYNVSTCVGIFDVANNVAMTVYPNPAKDVLNVVFADKLTSVNNITVVNVLGQDVYSANNVDVTTVAINTSSLTSGIYYLHVTSDNQVSVKSFTVAK